MTRWLQFPAKFAYLLSGLLIWALHFLFVYGLNGLACARGIGGTVAGGFGIVPAIILALTLMAIAVLLVILIAALLGRGPGVRGELDESVGRFWRFTTATIAGLSLVAVAWTGIPALLIPPCA